MEKIVTMGCLSVGLKDRSVAMALLLMDVSLTPVLYLALDGIGVRKQDGISEKVLFEISRKDIYQRGRGSLHKRAVFLFIFHALSIKDTIFKASDNFLLEDNANVSLTEALRDDIRRTYIFHGHL